MSKFESQQTIIKSISMSGSFVLLRKNEKPCENSTGREGKAFCDFLEEVGDYAVHILINNLCDA